jgi:iron complex transport system ATP-binding protein
MRRAVKLSTAHLSVGFRSNGASACLFRDLGLELVAGQLVCLMGPNGVGKSSLIRTLAGLQRPLGGSIEMPMKDPGNLPKNISVVLTHRVQGNMTARELVIFGRYPYLNWDVTLGAEDEVQIQRAIARTDIGDLLEKEIAQLSDGQIQLVMIARALAQNTPIILLDEPTAHLDLNNRVQIMRLLRTLCREMDKAILVATHELDLALQTADVIWLSGKEKNILTGVPEDLVLNGSFDEVFRFKGFDLKTGRILHKGERNVNVILKGSGHEYLWTRNALERAGFTIAAEDATRGVSVEVRSEESKPRWLLKKEDRLFTLSSIAELIELL